MKPETVAVLGILLAGVANASPTMRDATPTPLQKKERDRSEIEERLVRTKIALAYSCGYTEGKLRLVDNNCLEVRAIASDHGFRK